MWGWSPTPANGGAVCVGVSSETRECSTDPCPINGGFGGWSTYSKCSASCGGGAQSKERKCDSPPPQFGGKDCVGPTSESRSCNDKECPGKLISFINLTTSSQLCSKYTLFTVFLWRSSCKYLKI